MDGIKKVTTRNLYRALIWSVLLAAGVPLIVFGAMGILLCFYGFRMFRFSMAMAGFFIGMQLADFLDTLFLLEKIPADYQDMWVFFFPIVLGILLAILSYAIYQKALFFVSMFFTWYTLVKIALLYIIKTQNNLALSISLTPDSIAKLTDGSDGAQNLISDKQMSTVMSWIPGNSDAEKLLEHAAESVYNVNDLAGSLHVSRGTLFHAFKEVLKVSPIRYLHEKKLKKCLSLIAENPLLTFGEIAKRARFSDEKYFLRFL